MVDKTYKDMTFKIDNAAGSITAITSHLNNQSITGTMAVLENSALGDANQSFRPGIAGATVSINGFMNSTTEGIFGPLIGNDTAVTKTVEVYNGIQYYNGEAWVTNVQQSGAQNDLITFSADLTITGAVNRTSKALS